MLIVTCSVTNQKVLEPFLGWPVLEPLGLDARRSLTATSDCMENTLDVDELHADVEKNCTVRVYGVLEGIFTKDGGSDEAYGQEDMTGWCDLCLETNAE